MVADAEDRRLGGHDRHEPASSTLINHESDKPLHVQQADQIRAYREAWEKADHDREPRVSVSRSIFALTDDRDWAYFGGRGTTRTRSAHRREHRGDLRPQLRGRAQADRAAQGGRGHRRRGHPAARRCHPAQRRLRDASVVESVLTHVAPGLGWRSERLRKQLYRTDTSNYLSRPIAPGRPG